MAALLALTAAPASASAPQPDPSAIRALAAGADGSVWYALGHGVGVRRADGTSRAWPLPGATRAVDGWALARGRLHRVGGPSVRGARGAALAVVDGRPWVAGRDGLWAGPRRVAAGRFGDVTPARAGGVWTLREHLRADGTIWRSLERWTLAGRRSSARMPRVIDTIVDDGRGGVWGTSIFGGGFTRIDARGRREVARCADCGMFLALAPAPGGEAVAAGWSAGDDADVVAATGGGAATIVRRDRLTNGRSVAVLPDGRVVLTEPRAGRLTLLAPDGATESVRVPLPAARVPASAPRARAAGATIPVTGGFRVVRGGVSVRLSPSLYAKAAGRKVQVSCATVQRSGPGGIVRGEVGASAVVTAPRRRTTLRARLDVRRPDLCTLSARDGGGEGLQCDEGWCPFATQAFTEAGRVRLDELERAVDLSLVVLAAMLSATDRWPASLDEVPALAGPDAMPAGSEVAYWSDGVTFVAAARARDGRRLFVRVTGDTLSTNVPDWIGSP